MFSISVIYDVLEQQKETGLEEVMSEIILRDHLEEIIDSKITEAIYAAGLDSEEDFILHDIKESPVYEANLKHIFKRMDHLGGWFLDYWKNHLKKEED